MDGRAKLNALPMDPFETEPRRARSAEKPPGTSRGARIGWRGVRSPAPEDVRLRARELSEARGEDHVTLDDRLDAECELLMWESTVAFS